MKKTAKKFSLGVKIASILTCVVIAAAGFASWLIISPAEASEENGSFTVYDIETQDISIAVTPVEDATSSTKIVFGKTETTNALPWLQATDVASDALFVKFDVTVSSDGSALLNSVAKNIKVTFDVSDTVSANFDTAINTNCIAAPTLTLKANGEAIENGSGSYAVKDGESGGFVSLNIPAPAATSISFTVEVQFGWGSLSGNTNPYEYFNGLEADDTNIANATTVLTNVAAITGQDGTALDKAFTLTVETVSE